MRVRDATSEDAKALAGLMDGPGYPSTAEAMRERLATIGAHEDYRTLVAEVEGRVVGAVGMRRGLYYEADGVYVHQLALAVDQGERGKGIGTALVSEAEPWARSQGAALLLVNSGKHREDAHRFYERQGFRPTGVRFVKHLSERQTVPGGGGRPTG